VYKREFIDNNNKTLFLSLSLLHHHRHYQSINDNEGCVTKKAFRKQEEKEKENIVCDI
jgi:hypothetical protein